MPLVSMRQLLDEAAKGGYGVGAFNVNDMEQIQAIMEAARETKSPVIVQASRGARQYSQDNFLYHLMLAATELYPEIPTVLHLDHGNSVETCKTAIDMGFTSVMMDGSLNPTARPLHFRIQRGRHRKVVEMRTPKALPSRAKSAAWAVLKTATARASTVSATSPIPTRRWSSSSRPVWTPWPSPSAPATALTSSAVNPPGDAQDGRLIEIHNKLPNVHLVMHGSSSVPKHCRTSSTSTAAS